jgi:DNA-binding MarR family transcriptional regulator
MSSTSPAETAGAPPVSGLEDHLGYWLRFVSNHVSHAFRQKVERHGVTVAEWVVLRAVFEEEGVKPSQLSQKIGLTRGAVSKLLDRLAAKGLVVIRDDPHDGRAQIVGLNDPGRSLVPVLAAEADRNDAEAFGHLSAEERAALRQTLEGIVARLDLRGAPVD